MSERSQPPVHGFRQVDEVDWELPASVRADMRVPARVFADRELIEQIAADRSLEQLQNVAALPGITGAARAFPAGSTEIPASYRGVGQPVFIPGSMGASSFVLVGRQAAIERSFGTACHGAGRRMSRTGARRQISGAELRQQLQGEGIVVRCPVQPRAGGGGAVRLQGRRAGVAVVEQAGLAGRVAQLVPLGVVKG